MNQPAARTPLVYIVAGEASGDVLAAGLMKSLKRMTGGRVRFAGVGGDRMAAEGLTSLFPISEMAVLGVFEILPHAPKLLRRVQKRLFKRRATGQNTQFPLLHMVAPTVWAWRPGRAKTISKFLDELLVLFPFEPPYFEEHGLKTTFVGHPASVQPDGDGARLRARTRILPKVPVLGVLPGSRPGEVRRLLPGFGETVKRLAPRYPNLRVVIPTVPGVAEMVREGVKSWPLQPVILENPEDKYDAFSAMNAALAASGTVTLELALAGVPTVVGYKVNPLSVPIGRMLVNMEAVVLANWILKRPVQPFFMQNNCTPEALTVAVARLFDDSKARGGSIAAGEALREILGTGEIAPSDRAALAVAKAAGIALPEQP